jgi:hypothetical protein
VTESYFELLTEQQGMPAKSFDPLEELRRLRRQLTLRIQSLEPPEKISHLSFQTEIAFQEEVGIREPFDPEPISLETVVKQVGSIKKTLKKTLSIWQRSRSRSRLLRDGIFRARQKFASRRYVPTVIVPDSDLRGERTLERVSVGLTALGAIGVIFGTLSFYRGWENDLSLGTLVCVSGAAIIAVGLVGHILAPRSDFLAGWKTFCSTNSSRQSG